MNKTIIKKSFKSAFPYTLPICAGFSFLGLTYGIYMNSLGFSYIYPLIMSTTIFGGSLEFVAGSLLLSSFNPVQALILSLMVQIRHLFYGISMLDKFKNMGWKKFFLIFGMCDETFSINYTAKIPDDLDKGWFMLFVTILNYLYWTCSATIGGILGSFIKFNINGIGFVMTAMFIVIFLEQWFKDKEHCSSLIGIFSSLICLIIFNSENFMIPTMVSMIFFLTILQKPLKNRRCS